MGFTTGSCLSAFCAERCLKRECRRKTSPDRPWAKSGLVSSVSQRSLGDLLLRRNRLHASIQAALVAVCRVLVQNTLLHALIENRRGRTILGRRLFVIALRNCFTQLA